MIKRHLLKTAVSAVLSLLMVGVSAQAQADDRSFTETNIASTASNFTKFIPNPSKTTRLDYSLMDEALAYIVLDLGPSLRSSMPKPRPKTGTRFVHGHVSPYRMEGTRVTFDYITDDFLDGLTAYRKELEDIGTRVDIAKLSRDEQLAYWFNLHNITVLEQISMAYPVEEPRRIKVEINGKKTPLDDAKILTVKGQSLSLRDIRENIVFANWTDPIVLYGFYRGDLGSPKLHRNAFTGPRLDFLLQEGAGEFVNSLRGFRKSTNRRYVSELYGDLDGVYFDDFQKDLTSHLSDYANEELLTDINRDLPFVFDTYQNDISDLTNGRRRGSSGLALNGELSVSREVSQFMQEANEKRRTLINRGLITPRGGYVIIEDIIPEEENENGK